MPNLIESFQQAHTAHVNWQKDRPLIDKFNNSDIQVALDLLSDEIGELNGGDATGVFSHENIKDPVIREDYRQQEISDIVIFSMTAFDKLGVTIDLEEIYARVQAWADAYDFTVVSPEDSQFPPQAMSEERNELYSELKKRLNQEAAKIADYDPEVTTQEDLEQALESILVYSIAMHSLVGVNSAKAVMEKIVRNMLKYPAFMFQMPEEELSLEDLEAEYHRRRKDAATKFDGAFDPELGDRPKTGTTDFYTMPEEIQFEPGEMRPVGILYRAAAQVIASTYGFSVRVSNLLKK